MSQPINTLKTIATTFLIALGLYIVLYQIDEYLRVRKGPWEITFAAEADGTPRLTINQAHLGISNVTILLRGEKTDTNGLPKTLIVNQPELTAPYGERIFDDLMYLPGVFTLQVYGHEIEVLPRTLAINRKEQPWAGTTTLELWPTNKLPELSKPKKIKQKPIF